MPTETGPHGAGHTTNTEALEALLQEKAQKEPVPGLSVAVVKGNRIVWEQGFGFADLTSTLATSSTIYLWFSMTKIVTATAVLAARRGRKLRHRRSGRRVLSRLQSRVAGGACDRTSPTEPQLRARQPHTNQVGQARQYSSPRPARLRQPPAGQTPQAKVRSRRARQLL